MAMPTPHDPLSRPLPPGGFQAAMRQGRPPGRVGFSANLGLRSVDREVAAICQAAALRFADMGCVIDDDVPDFSGSIDSFQVLRALLFADVRGNLLPHERSRINPDIVWNIEKGQTLAAAEIIAAMRDRNALFHRVARFFDDHDLLICPTVAVPPFPVEQRFPTEIAGEKLTTYIDWMFLTFVRSIFLFVFKGLRNLLMSPYVPFYVRGYVPLRRSVSISVKKNPSHAKCRYTHRHATRRQGKRATKVMRMTATKTPKYQVGQLVRDLPTGAIARIEASPPR